MIHKVVKANTPTKAKIPDHKHRNPVYWWDDECEKARRLRIASFKKWEHTKELKDLIDYKQKVASAIKLFKSKKRKSFREFAKTLNIRTNLNYTWKKAKILKNKWVKTLNTNKDSHLQNDDELEIMINKLCPPWVPTDPEIIPNAKKSSEFFFDKEFTVTEFYVALESRGDRSAPGIDGINYEILHKIPDKCKLILLNIFNEMYKNDSYPKDWNTFIHFTEKPGGNGLRPLALTSCCSKLFELLLSNRLRWWVETQKILPKSQVGFRKGMSCADNLTVLTLEIDNAFKNKSQVLTAFLDVSGAFNNVLPDILLKKLAKIGVSTKFLKFIKSLIHERFIYTSDNMINPRTVYKGVAQGGVLSPLLYLIYVADIEEGLSSSNKLLQFADDIAIYRITNNVESSLIDFQNSIEKIGNNLYELGLDLSPKKTAFLCFNRKQKFNTENIQIEVNGNCIKSSLSGRFLGVNFDTRLKFSTHIRMIETKCNKALNILKFIRGTWWGTDPQTLLVFYKSYIRSIIDYACFIYFPTSNKNNREKLERVQYSAIRLAMGYRNSTPTNVMLSESKLLSLESRTNYLGNSYISKVLSNSSTLVYQTIKKYHIYSINDNRKKSLAIKDSILETLLYEKKILSLNQIPIYKYDFHTLTNPVNVDTDLGLKLKKSNNPDESLNVLINSNKSNTLYIYTDGSKAAYGKFCRLSLLL